MGCLSHLILEEGSWCHLCGAFACSARKLQFMPAVDKRGYPIKDACVLEDVGLVAVFDGLTSLQPGILILSGSALIQATKHS